MQIIDTIITFTNGILKSKSDNFKCIFATNQIYTFKFITPEYYGSSISRGYSGLVAEYHIDISNDNIKTNKLI